MSFISARASLQVSYRYTYLRPRFCHFLHNSPIPSFSFMDNRILTSRPAVDLSVDPRAQSSCVALLIAARYVKRHFCTLRRTHKDGWVINADNGWDVACATI
jgi:hypothetical protein